MRLIRLQIKNYKSISDSGEIRIEPLQALVGPNNSGKSNILYAIDVFLSPQAGGVGIGNFNDGAQPIVITATFANLLPEERRPLSKYLLGDKLILEKHLRIETDDRSGKEKVAAEYHGYMAEPCDWWLSVEGVER